MNLSGKDGHRRIHTPHRPRLADKLGAVLKRRAGNRRFRRERRSGTKRQQGANDEGPNF